jgi:hypothetical protein
MYPPENNFASPIGTSWRTAFKSNTKEELEKKGEILKFEVKWFEGDKCTISSIIPGIR